MTDDILLRLSQTIAARRGEDAGKSYTRHLLDGGPERCAKKFGEEAIEAMVAATSQDEAALRAEAADVLYHLLVLLESRGVSWAQVLETVAGREGVSGLAEKARRTPEPS